MILNSKFFLITIITMSTISSMEITTGGMELSSKFSDKKKSVLTKLQKLVGQLKNDSFDLIQKPNYTKVPVENILATQQLKKIITQHGWPTISEFGPKTAHRAWVIAQLSDHDLKFQKECLEYIAQAADRNNASWEQYAYLLDRTLIAENKKQKYGTQLDPNGKVYPIRYNINADAGLDELDRNREAMGLCTYHQYIIELFQTRNIIT